VCLLRNSPVSEVNVPDRVELRLVPGPNVRRTENSAGCVGIVLRIGNPRYIPGVEQRIGPAVNMDCEAGGVDVGRVCPHAPVAIEIDIDSV